MLLSRFWYVVLSLVLGAMLFLLFLATSLFNRTGELAMAQGLSADSQVVAWYLGADARQRSAQLIQFALEPEVQKALAESSKVEGTVSDAQRDKLRERAQGALRKVNERVPPESSFDAVFAVDQHGRVVAHLGYDQARGLEDFELGGYPVVADALHGFLRDDTLVLDRLYRVVARPVEVELGAQPAGAIVGARIIDDRFARELSERTGAAVAFYTKGSREASGAPEGFDKSQLDQIVSDMAALDGDEDYNTKGRSGVRMVARDLGVSYARLPGEAWALGAGYAVGRRAPYVGSPFAFFQKADDRDKREANVLLVALVAFLAAAVGLVFTFLEHTRPLAIFRREAVRLAKGETDQLVPSKFRGIFRKLASDLNDGIDQVAAKGGVPRRAADLKQVLGDLPAEPQMSAFSFPGDEPSRPRALPTAPSSPNATPPLKSKSLPKAPSPLGAPRDELPSSPFAPAASGGMGSNPGVGAPPAPRRPAKPAGDAEAQRLAEWRQVFEEFVATKRECGESLDGFTYEKFEQTLKKNQEALIQRHGAARVRFSVYVKDGKAALKASPLKE
jgi:hypothetical protein